MGDGHSKLYPRDEKCPVPVTLESETTMSHIESLRSELAGLLTNLCAEVLPTNDYQFRCILRNGLEVNVELRGMRWFNVRTSYDPGIHASCAELVPAHEQSRISNLTPKCRFGHPMLWWKIRSANDFAELTKYIHTFNGKVI
jgi:hypothetical protein